MSKESPDVISDDYVSTVHAKSMVIDAHADIEIPGRESPYVGPDGRSKVAPDKLEAGQVDAVVLSIAVGPGKRDEQGYASARRRTDKKLEAVRQMFSDRSNKIALATEPKDADFIKSQGGQAIFLGFQNTQSIGREIDALNEFYDEGVRIFALSHIGHNEFADSSRPNYIAETGQHEPDEEHGGLSALGREAITRLNRLGGLIDVSQMSRNATLETLELTESPVIASHSNVKALCDVSRNLTDMEIDAIGKSGGVIHLCPFRGYLFDTTDTKLVSAIRAVRVENDLPETYLYPFELYWEIKDADQQLVFRNAISRLLGEGTMDSMIDHVDYVVNRIGVDHVGIGSDFNHGGGLRAFNEASDAKNVTTALLQRGYSEESVGKIWGGNFLRAMSAAQARAHLR